MLGGVKGPREKEAERQRQRETETEADREREVAAERPKGRGPGDDHGRGRAVSLGVNESHLGGPAGVSQQTLRVLEQLKHTVRPPPPLLMLMPVCVMINDLS